MKKKKFFKVPKYFPKGSVLMLSFEPNTVEILTWITFWITQVLENKLQDLKNVCLFLNGPQDQGEWRLLDSRKSVFLDSVGWN